MKLFVFIIPLLLSLEPGLLVSPGEITEEVNNLILLADETKGAAEYAIMEQYDQTKREMNKTLYENIIPSLNDINQDLDNYIQNLENDTSSLGYNATDCITRFQINLIVGAVPNITSKAITEMQVVYERIISDILTAGLYSMDVIKNEVFSTTNDSTLCLNSTAPDTCTDPLLSKILAKQEEIPILFNKEVHRVKYTFIQQIVNYESRAQDYLHEAVAVTKPYLELLESCVSVLLAAGKGSQLITG